MPDNNRPSQGIPNDSPATTTEVGGVALSFDPLQGAPPEVHQAFNRLADSATDGKIRTTALEGAQNDNAILLKYMEEKLLQSQPDQAKEWLLLVKEHARLEGEIGARVNAQNQADGIVATATAAKAVNTHASAANLTSDELIQAFKREGKQANPVTEALQAVEVPSIPKHPSDSISKAR